MTHVTDLSARAFRVEMIQGRKVLVPSDVFAEETMSKWKVGCEILVNWRKPRSVQQLRLLFAMLRKVVETSDLFADEEILLENLKQATGLVVTRFNAITGHFYEVVASISFESMTQDRFNVWLEKAIEVLARDVLSVMPKTLRDEVFAMLEDKRIRFVRDAEPAREKPHERV